jgi:phosphatidylethanolamine-binding protein
MQRTDPLSTAVLSQPTVGVLQRPQGTQFAVIMVDLDIPTNTPPQTNTLLHWMQTGLTLAAQPSRIAGQSVFLLENRGNATAAAAAYIAPNPPARIPLSHRYTFILVDTSGIQAAGVSTLTTAAATRMGFNAESVLSSAGLEGRVVAGNFFNVTNPGPVNSTGTGFGGATTTGGSPVNPTGTGFVTAAGSVVGPWAGGVLAAVGLVAAALLL